ncbi:calcium-binding protein, partial [Pseudorhodoferax sp. Leaf265]|uniref:calcium-binding protein n=1 Tax=Pseudorhodoferax sp. Leaf265 TaxID=1736315 RepID=UPI00138F5F1A
ATNGWQIEEIRFTDAASTVWTVANVKAMVLTGTNENDVLRGYATNDTLSGGAGSDTLYGAAGDDTLLAGAENDMLVGDAGNDLLKGEAGDDTLQGGAGDDTLDGGTGNDILAGGVHEPGWSNFNGVGNDTYLFGRGDGVDIIRDADTTAGNVDKLVFKAGVAVGQRHLGRWRSRTRLVELQRCGQRHVLVRPGRRGGHHPRRGHHGGQRRQARVQSGRGGGRRAGQPRWRHLGAQDQGHH